MSPTICLVIATVSRPTLARTLESLRRQDWRAGDEVLLVGDGPQPAARDLWPQYGLPGRYLETPGHLGVWGHGVRNWVMDEKLPRASHVAALDDDDEWTPNALRTIRAAVEAIPDRPHIFRMTGHWVVGDVWKDPVLRKANVGTPMMVAPNYLDSLARYGGQYDGDFDFISGTCGFYPQGPVWQPAAICRVRPPRM